MIMEAIPGLKLVEMPRNREYSRCCGAGGGLKAGFPDIQNKMARRRIQEAEETGAEQLVSCCPFCYQGLNVGITALASQIVMRDISGLVAESLLGYDVFERAAQKTAAAEDKKTGQVARKEARTQKKEKALRRKGQETAPDQTPAAATETAAKAPRDVVSDAADLTTAKDKSVTETAASDSKTEKERKRAEKRAAREKEKAARRAAREKL
jgi:heterodisulfide reductase subunit D